MIKFLTIQIYEMQPFFPIYFMEVQRKCKKIYTVTDIEVLRIENLPVQHAHLQDEID